MEFAEAIGKPRVDGVRLRRLGRPGASPSDGSLAVTGHHLIFSASAADVAEGERELWLLHRAVDLVSLETKSSGTSNLTLKCKDLAVLVLEFSSAEDAAAVGRSVEILSSLEDTALAYPFFHRAPFAVLEDGWTAFSAEEQLNRLQLHTDFWRLSWVNAGWAVCGSYPEQLIVPREVPDEALAASAAFRRGGRFPVLAYFHAETKSALVRCGEPLVGSGKGRCREDEALLSALAGKASRGYVLETRTAEAAKAARAKGGGSEPDQHYPMWKRLHRSLPKPAHLADSYAKLADALGETDKWWAKVSSSAWQASVAELLTTACLLAQSIDREEMSVVVHGGEGLDGTLCVTSLVALVLDGDARSVRGFCALVEREWVGGGHPFGLRCAQGPWAKPRDGTGPAFALFLHAAAALLQQFQFAFQFTDELLLLCLHNAYASDYGTFLGRSDKDRASLRLKERTTSLWSLVHRPEVLEGLLNPFYEPQQGPVWPSVAPQSLPLWERALFRHSRNWDQQDAARKAQADAKREEAQLQVSVTRLRRQIVELERLANAPPPVNSH